MAELKLNIYSGSGREIVKTYTAEQFDIMFGTVEDILETIDFDNLSDEQQVVKTVTAMLGKLKPFLKQIFDGLTDEEIKCTKVKELVPLFADIVFYMLDEMKGITVSKNFRRA